MPKLTKEYIEKQLQFATTGQQIIRDDELVGFAVRVTKMTKSFIVEKRVNGKNFRVTIGRCDRMSVRDARSQATTLLSEMSAGFAPVKDGETTLASRVTLGEAYQKYLAVRPLTAATRKLYRYAMETCLSDWLDLPFLSITKDMVEDRHRELSNTPTRLGTSGHARANNTLRSLKAVLNFASERYSCDGEPLIKRNPVDRLTTNKQWHERKIRDGYISNEHLRGFYSVICDKTSDLYRDYLLFLLLTGMRKTEAMCLKWADVDFERRVINVPKEITKMQRAYVLPLSDYVFVLMSNRKISAGNSAWVFPSSKNMSMHIANCSRILPEIRSVCEYHFQLHDLRRTFISMGAKIEVPFHVLKTLVNHKLQKEMTERYMIVDIQTQRTWMQKISNELLRLMSADLNHLLAASTDTTDNKLPIHLQLRIIDRNETRP